MPVIGGMPLWDGKTFQGHEMSEYAFSFDQVARMYRAMGGDEGTARLAEENVRLRQYLEAIRVSINEALNPQEGEAA